jgi:hypothetical protein
LFSIVISVRELTGAVAHRGRRSFLRDCFRYGHFVQNLTADFRFFSGQADMTLGAIRFRSDSPYDDWSRVMSRPDRARTNKTRMTVLLFAKGRPMQTSRLLISTALLLMAGGAAKAGDQKVLASGPPALTQDMVDDYARFAEWHWGITSARVGGKDRFRQMMINTWSNGDKGQKEIVLAGLKWWREEYPKLSAAGRERLNANGPAASQGLQQALRSSANNDAIHQLQLRLNNDARQREILGVNAAAANGHETNMRIIDNYRPGGRYEYNPATGRYDRWVPYR